MKYICIDDGAVSEIISGREYQSVDFEQGDKLIRSLSGAVHFVAKLGRIDLFQDSEGVFLTTSGPWKQKKFLVIDCEQSSLFTQLRETESLSSFQKLLRFCSKYWSGGVFSRSERVIAGTSKVVIFPLPFSSNSQFRIAIEREPLKDRLVKRDLGNHFLLVYKSGREGGDSTTEQANTTNFRKVVDRVADIYDTVSRARDDMSQAGSGGEIGSTSLGSQLGSVRPIHMPFKDWLPLLTAQQRKFVYANSAVPHRLQGPAGTGKTLSLILRTVRILEQAEKRGEKCHALLITHSEATREAIRNALSAIDQNGYQLRERQSSSVLLAVETLASLCASVLSQSISESEFVDRDAEDSKILQQMYIEKAIEDARRSDFSSFKPHLSEEFRTLFESSTNEDLAPLFQHEISVLIKGRAGDSLDVYRNCPSLKYGLSTSNDADRGFAFCVFRGYQKQLEASSQFDTDDVVISAIGQLDTPIWRRRRMREGFDFIGIDETHLFNMNELHVFHHFTRATGEFPISFSVDQAQAVGDRGWNDISEFGKLFGGGDQPEEENTSYIAVFRSSPQIIDFCHSVLASGATLFTNFENTLLKSQSAFTPDDERRSEPVSYIEYADDRSMLEGAFQRADELQSATQSTRSQVLITTLSDDIIKLMRDYAEQNNKPITVLERRGDFTKIKQAEKSGHIVLGHADFVGGLEFNAVVVVGVDKGRVPYEGSSENHNSRNYSSYAAHNRLYVACSRAKYALSILGVKSRGASSLLNSAALRNLIEVS